MSELEKKLRDQVKVHRLCGAVELGYLFLNAANRIRELESEGWISVEDKLPDKSDIYQVYPSGGFHVSYYGATVNKFAITTLYKVDVTHWMETPTPPKAAS